MFLISLFPTTAFLGIYIKREFNLSDGECGVVVIASVLMWIATVVTIIDNNINKN